MTKTIHDRVMKILDDQIRDEEFTVNNTEWSMKQINANARMVLLKSLRIRIKEAIEDELGKLKHQ